MPSRSFVETAAAAAGERITVALAICRAWSTVSVTEKTAFIGRSPNLIPERVWGFLGGQLSL